MKPPLQPPVAAMYDLTGLGPMLRHVRRMQGKKIHEISEALGVSQATVGLWERSLVEPPFEKLQRYSDILGIKVGFVVTFEEDTFARLIDFKNYLKDKEK